MDFGYNNEEESYRLKLKAFLDENLTEEIARQNWEDKGVGKEAREFSKKLAAEGLLGKSWPVMYGGQGLPQSYDYILLDELGRRWGAHVPLAIGYTMVYGIIGMINFAHGDIFMIGAFIALIAFILFGLTGIALPIVLFLVLLISMLFTACYGWSVEKLAYKPLRGSFRLAPLISALGMSIVLQNYVQVAQGARVKPLQPLISGGLEFFKESEFIVTVSYLQIFIVFLTIILMSMFTLLITKTDLGRAQRACEQDRTMTSLLGINVDRTISITFILGSSLASVAGMMFVLYYGVIDFYIGFLAGVKAFTAAVLGGIGSLPGAMLGGLLIGLIETMWSGYISIEYKDVAAFSVLIITLIFFPTGFLGKPDIEKV